MYKSFILAILTLSIFSSCSFNNPLSEKVKLTYLDCPKSLILAPGSSLIKDNINISLINNYSINCYYIDDFEEEIIFDFDYELSVDISNSNKSMTTVNFWIFLTNKKETKKISESSFRKSLDLSDNDKVTSNKISYLFSDSITINRAEYSEGLRIFLSIN